MRVLLPKLILPVLMLLLVQQSHAQIKVACLGDSITEGSGLDSRKGDSTYPLHLQKLLGGGYEVKNFGNSGKTLTNGKEAYVKTDEYKNALAFKPNIVVIMLGSNDTKPDRWVSEEKFYNDYKLLIETLKSLPEIQQIYICYPIRAFNNKFKISNSVLKGSVIPAIKLVGRRTNVNIIDLYSPFHDKLALLPDGVHPIEEGAKLIATEVFQVISK